MTLYIGQQHPITVYRTVFCVCVVLVLSVIRCSCYYFLDRIIFHHDVHHDICDYNWDVNGHYLLFELHFRLSYLSTSGSANALLPGCFHPSVGILLENLIEHVTFGLLYIMFTFLTRIFYRGVAGMAPDCPCGVWCRRLTTCLLYVFTFLEI